MVPSTEPEDQKRQDKEVEAIALTVAWAYEESQGALVKNVSTPQLARDAGLTDHPGFDLLSKYLDAQQLSIEVKGRGLEIEKLMVGECLKY